MDAYTDECMAKETDICLDNVGRWLDRTHGWLIGRMNGQLDRWVGG